MRSRVTISYIWTTHGTKIFPTECKVNGQTHWTWKYQCEFWAVEHYTFNLESPCQTNELSMSQGCFLLNLGSKGQRSSSLDIKVAI